MDHFITMLQDIDWNRWAGPAKSSVRIALILLLAWLATGLAQRAVRALRTRITARMGGAEQVSRTETLSRVVRYLITLVIFAVALMLVLSEIGISLAPILGAAGVVGVAIGFGAQSLVKDYFSGFFLLLEDQIRTGDVVAVAGISGKVEDVTLRHVRLRDYEGNVHFVPNGLITTVTNRGRGFSFAVMDIGVAYREDVDAALDVMRAVAAELRAEPAFAARILDDFEVAGVDKLGDSAVMLRGRFRVVALAQWEVRREYFRRIKAAFDREAIEIPYPHLTIYAGQAKDGTSPPLRVAIDAAVDALPVT